MVCLGIIVAAWFTKLPEWTTWVLLVALAVYDLVAVLAPGGPLKLLVELASTRDEELPALIYEARPTVAPRATGGGGSTLGLLITGVSESEPEPSSVELQVMSRNGVNRNVNVGENESDGGNIEYSVVTMGDFGNVESHRGGRDGEEERSLLVGNLRESRTRFDGREGEIVDEEMSPLVNMVGVGNDEGGVMRRDVAEIADRGIKLGLGDFVFYSVLVGRAAMYDLMTVYACYLAIISGLGCTLILLSVCRQALPALPISITLGVLFYFLTRLLMEPFIVGTATNLMMF